MQADTTQPTVKKGAPWKLALNLVLLLVLAALIARQVQKVWPDIARYDWSLNWGLAVAALLVLATCSFLDILIWNRTLGWFTDALSFRAATPVYIWSSLARFIPGKVASLVLRVTLSAEAGRPAVPVLAASTVELALRTAAALLMGLLALLTLGASGKQSTFLIASIAAVVPITLICAHPKVMLPVTNWGLKKLKKPAITKPLRYREVLGLLVALIARWVLFGLAFLALTAAILPSEARKDFLVLIGLGPSSWAVGFMSMLPGGLGGMETVQGLVMHKAFGIANDTDSRAALVVIVIALFRLISIAAEGAWAVAGIALRSPVRGTVDAPAAQAEV